MRFRVGLTDLVAHTGHGGHDAIAPAISCGCCAAALLKLLQGEASRRGLLLTKLLQKVGCKGSN